MSFKLTKAGSFGWLVGIVVVLLLCGLLVGGFAAIKATSAANSAEVAAKAAENSANASHKLLENGKSVAAINAKSAANAANRDEALLKALTELIRSGMSAGAQNAKLAAEAAKPILNTITTNHQTAVKNREILCSLVVVIGDTDPPVLKICAASGF